MSKINDLTGQRFGKLIAVKINGRTKQNSVTWLCQCDCGKETIVRAATLRNKSTQSCGCSKIEVGRKNILDLSGKVFGRLTVLGLSVKRVAGRICWDCVCECGSIKSIISNNLVRGIATSCGCYNREILKNSRHRVKRYSGLTYLYEIYRSNAQVKDLSFDLSLEEFKTLTSECCYYCGSVPSRETKSRKARISYIYNGIDRKDNLAGYVSENCVPCCSFCNYAKRNHPYDDFLSWLDRIAEFRCK